MTISLPVRRIAVIGAGPCGLSAVKYENFRYRDSTCGHITYVFFLHKLDISSPRSALTR